MPSGKAATDILATIILAPMLLLVVGLFSAMIGAFIFAAFSEVPPALLGVVAASPAAGMAALLVIEFIKESR